MDRTFDKDDRGRDSEERLDDVATWKQKERHAKAAIDWYCEKWRQTIWIDGLDSRRVRSGPLEKVYGEANTQQWVVAPRMMMKIKFKKNYTY